MTSTSRVAGSMPAAWKAAVKARRCESVSTVEPDLEAMTTTVCSRSSLRIAETICGSVVSHTTRSTPSFAVITSGASEEPPIPHSTMRVRPSATSSSRRFRIAGTSSSAVSKGLVQPSRMAASDSASGPHRVGSWAAMRLPTLSSSSRGRFFSTEARAAPEVTRPSSIYLASLSATAMSCSSSFQESSNFLTPSVSSCSTTWL